MPKLLKPLFTGILITLICSCVFPVSANTKEYAQDESIRFEKTLDVEPNTITPNMMFHYEITPKKQGGLRSDTTSTSKAISVEPIHFPSKIVEEDGHLSKTGLIQVDESYFEKPGVYPYTIKEVAPDLEGLHHESNEFDMDVYIEQKDGKLSCQGIVMYQKESKEKMFTFASMYQTRSFLIEKLVEGNHGDKQEDFAFEVCIAPPQEEGMQYQAIKHGQEEVEVLEPIQGHEEYHFTLKDQERLEIRGVGIDANIHAKELDENQNGYQTRVENNFDKLLEDNQKMTFINRKERIVPTGVRVKVAPYLCAIVVASILGFYVLKKES